MRLLTLQGNGDVSLVEVFSPLPPYAILSHTWGADHEEVNFEEVLNGKGKEKAGYRKLVFCGEQASRHGLDHFWVDTCCIDKSSSAELTEAINSMFRWYQESARCFVYMSDVFLDTDSTNGLTQRELFRQSRWFKRGWTLQELIAPASIEFYTRDGDLLGDKKSLQQAIHETTGIAIEALEGSSLDKFSIQTRMSWAALRTTKREEDGAYSLLGLFGVHMPLIYGEGRRNAFNRLQKEIRELHESVVKRTPSRESEQRTILEGILDWLEPGDPSSNFEQALKRRQDNTGLWLLRDERYKRWKTASGSFLWIYGIPGSGKTILSSTVVDDILRYNQNDTQAALVYFFFDFNDAQKQEAGSMVRSLVFQLAHHLDGNCPELTSLHARYMHGRGQPSNAALLEGLERILNRFSRVYLILDALDECSQRAELMQILATIARWNAQNTHIVVTSRLERDIEIPILEFAEDHVKLALDSTVIDEDIRHYVRHRLSHDQSLRKWRGDSELRREIERVLIRGSQGMFRWAVCQLDTLGRCRSRARLRASLAALPSTLEHTYDRILCNIQEEDSLYAIRILRWLTFANRSLTVEEIAETVAVDAERDPAHVKEEELEDPLEVLDICSSLVVVTTDPDDGRPVSRRQHVMLAHSSVKEYLRSDNIQKGLTARYSMHDGQCHEVLARTCLSYLLQVLQSATRLEDILERYKLVRYCAEHWMYHAKNIGHEHKGTADLAIRLLSHKITYTKWLEICKGIEPSQDREPTITVETTDHALFYAALFGLADVVELLLGEGVDVKLRSRPHQSALHAAAVGGHNQVVTQLLTHSVGINTFCAPWGSALQAACVGGHEQTVRLLLDTGANINTLDGTYGTALQIATRNGSTTMVDILLKHGADVSTANSGGWCSLHLASLCGNVDTAKLLLRHGADIAATNTEGKTPIRIASSQGHVDLVRLFHDHGADLSVSDNKGWTPLISAVSRGHDNVVHLLLNYNKESNIINKMSSNSLNTSSGLTALDCQVFSGISPAAEDVHGETAATRAAERGFMGILTLLFDSSVIDKNYRDRFGRSLLWWAAAHGQVDTVSFLLHQYRCDPTIPDHCGRAPHMIAAKKGFTSVAKALIAETGDNQIPYGQHVIPARYSPITCDICTIAIAAVDFHLHCGTCANGDWDICLECSGFGMTCMEATHTLVKRTRADDVWVETE